MDCLFAYVRVDELRQIGENLMRDRQDARRLGLPAPGVAAARLAEPAVRAGVAVERTLGRLPFRKFSRYSGQASGFACFLSGSRSFR